MLQNVLNVFLVFCPLLAHTHRFYDSSDVSHLSCVSTVRVHVFVTHCISVEHWKQPHHCRVRGHLSSESRQKVEQGRGNVDTTLSVSDGLDNGR